MGTRICGAGMGIRTAMREGAGRERVVLGASARRARVANSFTGD